MFIVGNSWFPPLMIFNAFWTVSTPEDVQRSNWSVRDVRRRPRRALRPLGCTGVSIVGLRGRIRKAESLFWRGLKRPEDTPTAAPNEPGGGSGTFQWGGVKRAAFQAKADKRLQLQHLGELFTARKCFITRVPIQPQLCALADVLLFKMCPALPIHRPNGRNRFLSISSKSEPLQQPKKKRKKENKGKSATFCPSSPSNANN